MVRRIIGFGLLLTGILLGASQGGAQFERNSENMPKSFISGKDWKALSKGEQQAYAVGVVDGLDRAYAYHKKKIDLSWINPCVTGISSEQVRAMLAAEIDANPEEWNRLIVHQSMFRALKNSCQKYRGVVDERNGRSSACICFVRCIYFHPEITGFFKDPWGESAPLIGLHHLRP